MELLTYLPACLVGIVHDYIKFHGIRIAQTSITCTIARMGILYDGSLVSVNMDNTLTKRDPLTLREKAEPCPIDEDCDVLFFMGKLLLIFDYKVQIYDPIQELYEIHIKTKETIWDANMISATHLLLTFQFHVRLYEWNGTRFVPIGFEMDLRIKSYHIMLNDNHIACTQHNQLYVINFRKGISISNWQAHKSKVYGIVRIDNRRVASFSNDTILKIWTTKCKQPRRIQTGLQIASLHLMNDSSNPKRIMSRHDNGLKIWNTQTGECEMTLETGCGHILVTPSSIYHYDSKRIVMFI